MYHFKVYITNLGLDQGKEFSPVRFQLHHCEHHIYILLYTISALLIQILCCSMQTILLQPHHRSLVFTATSSCCLNSLQTHQCHSPSRRSCPAVMTPQELLAVSSIIYQHNHDQHNCQELVVESAIERLHQGIKGPFSSILSSQVFVVIGFVF